MRSNLLDREPNSYVVVSRGRRDYFEVPLALAEVGGLERLVTDHYLSSLGGLTRFATRLFPSLDRRYRVGVSSRRVVRTDGWSFGASRSDNSVGFRGGEIANATGALGLVYSYYLDGYLEAATREVASPVVFQVHPAAEQVRAAMESCHSADLAIGPEPEQLMSAGEIEDEIERLHSASKIIVASGCTREGLVSSGLDIETVRMVTYGGDRAGLGRDRSGPTAPKLRLLYVGQVSRRKGIGTLLTSMKRLGEGCVELTIVTRDRRIDQYRREMDRADIALRTARDRELAALFGDHDVLVLPSYIEGAGLVLSEALAAGLWIVATPYSAGPELISRYGRGLLVEPGDPDALSDTLQVLVGRKDEIREGRREAAALGFDTGPTWESFRVSIRKELGLPAVSE